ncbi:MAG: ABC transporter ATP-binding protein [Clostridia bacterium]|nr:ABC transporter ATP-binding protein [Clostridia bacterium]
MAEVVLKNVSKKYGQLEAVKNLSLDCKDGEFVVILGPSGAGKTTTLKMIAGLEKITAGQVFIGGREVNQLEPRQRRVAMVFENYALYPQATVYENIASPLRAARVPQAELDKRVKQVAGMLQIDQYLDRKPANLSGGQQQRVSFGRALIKQADVYLMDEPLTHLDAKLRHEMRRELRRMHSELGTSTLYVTHDFREAMALADRMLVLMKGEVQQVGTPSQIYYEPANERVADLIGEPPMNLLPCSLVHKDGGVHFDSQWFSMPVPESILPAIGRMPNSGEVHIGIRPGDIRVTNEPAKGRGFRAEVYVLEPLGGVAVLTVKIGGSLWKIRVSDEYTANIGDVVWIELAQDRLHVFDAASGLRII